MDSSEEPSPLPHDYHGLYQREVGTLKETSALALSQCWPEDIQRYRPLEDLLKQHLSEWSDFDPVATLVHAEAIHRTFDWLRYAIYKALTNEAPTACDVDYDGIERNLRAIVESRVITHRARNLRGRSAETFMNIVTLFLSNRRAFSWREDVIKLLANVSDDAEALPSSARLENVHLEKPKIVTFGPWGEIAQGKYKGMLVAMKKMKSPQLIKQSRREVLTNLIASVDHPNVHPLLGFVNGVELIVISQWQEYGDLNAFLRRLKARGERPNFPMLFRGIAAGIEHLHSQIPPIVHGNLHGGSILVGTDGNPCISLGASSGFQYNRDRTQTGTNFSGRIRSMAPELLEEDRPTVLTDIYGFGMTLLEALTGGMPFHDLVGIIQVIRALATRERPALPSPPPSPLAHYIPLIKRCWRGDKNARPDIKHVIAELNWVAEHQHGTLGTGKSFVPLHRSTLKIKSEVENELHSIKTRLERRLDIEIRIGRNFDQIIPLLLIGPEHDVHQGKLEIKRWEATGIRAKSIYDRSDEEDEFDQGSDALGRVEDKLHWKDQRGLVYENNISALQNMGSALVATLEVNFPDSTEIVHGNLERLRVENNKWLQFDFVDTVVHANMMFEIIDSVKRGLQEYDALSRREIYPEIIPPSDLPYLPSMMRNIENDATLRTKAINLSGQHAILFIDLLMEVLDKYPDGIGRGDLLKLLQRVVEASNQLPSRLLITGVTDMVYQDKGGEATIFKCSYGSRDVAARVIHVKSRGEDEDMTRSLQEIRREIITHRQLKNRNILELLGIFKSDQHPLTIITPWMENGEALKYLKAHPENFIIVVRGLCAAIRYLHCCEPPIVHGDVKPSNVLIDEHGEAILSDFGFTRIRHELTRTGTRSTGLGTLRYLAPEAFSGDVPRATLATDIYSSALTIWGFASSELPFAQLSNEFIVLRRVLKGERPPMPTMIGTFHSQSEGGKLIWGLLERMWHQNPKSRPPMTLVKKKIDSIVGPA